MQFIFRFDILKIQEISKKGGKNAAAEAPKASGFYTVLALLTLIIVLAGTIMTALHYVKFEHKLDYSHLVPGVPQAK